MAQTIQLISRVIAVLDALADPLAPSSLATIAERAGLPKSTTRRILLALGAEEFVYQEGEYADYRMGPRLVRLSARVIGSLDIRREAKPMLDELSDRLGASVFLSELLDDEVICVDSVEHSSGVRFYVQVGKRMPLHVSSAAQVIVAPMAPHDRDRIIAVTDFTSFTERTILTPEELRVRLEKVARQGYAICDEEMEPGVRAIAVAIPRHPGEPPATSICVIGVSRYLSTTETERALADLRATAARIAARMGVTEPVSTSAS